MKKLIVTIYCMVLAAALLFCLYAYALETRPVDRTMNNVVAAEKV